MGRQILKFKVRAFLTCCNMTDKAPCEYKQYPYTHCTAVRHISYRTVMVHTIIIETSYANKASEVFQTALVTITL
jgi:hypothetical protein